MRTTAARPPPPLPPTPHSHPRSPRQPDTSNTCASPFRARTRMYTGGISHLPGRHKRTTTQSQKEVQARGETMGAPLAAPQRWRSDGEGGPRVRPPLGPHPHTITPQPPRPLDGAAPPRTHARPVRTRLRPAPHTPAPLGKANRPWVSNSGAALLGRAGLATAPGHPSPHHTHTLHQLCRAGRGGACKAGRTTDEQATNAANPATHLGDP